MHARNSRKPASDLALTHAVMRCNKTAPGFGYRRAVHGFRALRTKFIGAAKFIQLAGDPAPR